MKNQLESRSQCELEEKHVPHKRRVEELAKFLAFKYSKEKR